MIVQDSNVNVLKMSKQGARLNLVLEMVRQGNDLAEIQETLPDILGLIESKDDLGIVVMDDATPDGAADQPPKTVDKPDYQPCAIKSPFSKGDSSQVGKLPTDPVGPDSKPTVLGLAKSVASGLNSTAEDALAAFVRCRTIGEIINLLELTAKACYERAAAKAESLAQAWARAETDIKHHGLDVNACKAETLRDFAETLRRGD